MGTPPASTSRPPVAELEDPSEDSDFPLATPSMRDVRLRNSLSRDFSNSREISLETTTPSPAPALTPLRSEVCPNLTVRCSERVETFSRSPTPPSSSPQDVVATGPTPVVSSTTRTRTSLSGSTRRITPESSPWRRETTSRASSTDSLRPLKSSRRFLRRTDPTSCTTNILVSSSPALPTSEPVTSLSRPEDAPVSTLLLPEANGISPTPTDLESPRSLSSTSLSTELPTSSDGKACSRRAKTSRPNLTLLRPELNAAECTLQLVKLAYILRELSSSKQFASTTTRCPKATVVHPICIRS